MKRRGNAWHIGGRSIKRINHGNLHHRKRGMDKIREKTGAGTKQSFLECGRKKTGRGRGDKRLSREAQEGSRVQSKESLRKPSVHVEVRAKEQIN